MRVQEGRHIGANGAAFVQAAPAKAELGAEPDALARWLGAAAVVPLKPVASVQSRFNLVGVISLPSPRMHPVGVALIAVDGKPARPYRVGQPVDDSYRLSAVSRQSVELQSLGEGLNAAPLTLSLPLPVAGPVPPARPPAAAPPIAAQIPPPPQPGAVTGGLDGRQLMPGVTLSPTPMGGLAGSIVPPPAQDFKNN